MGIDRGAHDYHELLCLLTPYAVQTGGRTHEGRPGDVFFYPAGHPHRNVVRRDWSARFYLLNWHDDLPGFGAGRQLKTRDHQGRLLFLLHWMSELFPARDQDQSALLQSLLTAALAEHRRLSAGPPLTTVERVRHYMADRLERQMSLRELANFAGCSPRHLIRRFRQETGRTPGQCQQELRIEAALALLRTTDLPLAGIAARLGLTGRCHLSRLIKRHTGRPASDFRDIGFASGVLPVSQQAVRRGASPGH